MRVCEYIKLKCYRIQHNKHIQKHINPNIEIIMYGQEINEQTYAIAKSDVLIMGEDADNIKPESSFSKDGFRGKRFNFMLSNSPFGVSWKKEQAFIKKEANDRQVPCRTPAGKYRGASFISHMISKMETGGSRIAIIFNGSPLFTGDAIPVKAISANGLSKMTE